MCEPASDLAAGAWVDYVGRSTPGGEACGRRHAAMPGSDQQREVCASMGAVDACECGDGASRAANAAGAVSAERGLVVGRVVSVDGMDEGRGGGDDGDDGVSGAHGEREHGSGVGQVAGGAGI